MNPQPDLKLLATFLAVVHHGSMAEAAAMLGYVPSAVSQHVAALERDLGVELIARRPGSPLIITAIGRSLVEAAESLFDATARFQDAANAIANREIAELRVGCYPSALSHLLPEVLSTLKARGHLVRIRLIDVETHVGLPRVKSGDMDLLIAYRYLPEDPPSPSDDLTFTFLGSEPLVIATGAGPGRPDDLAHCMQQEWISGHAHSADRRLLHRWAGELGLAPHVTFETEDVHSMLEMIRAGLAVGLIPATLLSGGDEVGIKRVVLPPGIPPLNRQIFAVSRTGVRPELINELVTLLTQTLRSSLAPDGLERPT